MTVQEVAQLLATLQSDVYNGKINPQIEEKEWPDLVQISLSPGVSLTVQKDKLDDLLNR